MSITQIDNLNPFERELVLRFLLHHMDQKTRRKLMTTLPVPYRKLVGMGADDKFEDNLRTMVFTGYPVRVNEEVHEAAGFTQEDQPREWCVTNDCERDGCHRCFPRDHCVDHAKCREAFPLDPYADYDEGPVDMEGVPLPGQED